MARQQRRISSTAVGLLLALSAIWGSSFLLVKFALATMPPLTVSLFRIAVAALALTALSWGRTGGWPRGDRRFWGAAAMVGITGMALPFCLIAWGLTATDSGIAGILTASVPLWTMLLAHLLLPDESINRIGLTGIVIGFIGILLLFADKMGGATRVFSAGLILMASLSYAAMAIFIKKNAAANTLDFSTAVTWCALAVLAPIALVVERPWRISPDTQAVVSIFVLGALHTGIATVMLMKLIQVAGATYASMTNYLAPMAAIVLGAVFLDERLPAAAGLGFALIALGVYLTGRRPAPPGRLRQMS